MRRGKGGGEVAREAPAGEEGLAVHHHLEPAQQRFETGERGQDMDRVDPRQQRRHGFAANDLVSRIEQDRVGDVAQAVPGIHVRMGLE